ncbi:MAG: MerR family transcriptional regulator [Chloroflexota bacterium]|nr:MerR family transcriptional regulator [Chloroflexota bacterium]
MTTTRQGPYFNLKAVVRQTGLKPDTLRAWERRYGLPDLKRSDGGHRLFTQRDIETIRWLMTRQKEGMSIKRAVDLWRQIEGDGRDPLAAAMPMARSVLSRPQPSGGTITELRAQWVDSCLGYDEGRCEEILNQAFALFTPETVVTELMQEGVAQVGQGWYQGRVTVQQEHFCSVLVARRLEALVLATAPPIRQGRILVACPPGEQHVIAPLILTFLLRRRGWDVVTLGANVPVAGLDSTIDAMNPDLLIMAAQQLHTAAALVTVAAGVPLAYGGLIFNLAPELRERIPGHFLGEDFEAASRLVDSLMTAPRPLPQVEQVSEAYGQARDHFKQFQPIIEASVIQAMGKVDMPCSRAALANRELSRGIGAALALGDMGLLGADIEWIKGLLANRNVPAEALFAFLDVYDRAIRENLDARGQPISAWLGGLREGQGTG